MAVGKYDVQRTAPVELDPDPELSHNHVRSPRLGEKCRETSSYLAVLPFLVNTPVLREKFVTILVWGVFSVVVVVVVVEFWCVFNVVVVVVVVDAAAVPVIVLHPAVDKQRLGEGEREIPVR